MDVPASQQSRNTNTASDSAMSRTSDSRCAVVRALLLLLEKAREGEWVRSNLRVGVNGVRETHVVGILLEA